MEVTIIRDKTGVADGDGVRMAMRGEVVDQPDEIAEKLIEKKLAVKGKKTLK